MFSQNFPNDKDLNRDWLYRLKNLEFSNDGKSQADDLYRHIIHRFCGEIAKKSCFVTQLKIK